MQKIWCSIHLEMKEKALARPGGKFLNFLGIKGKFCVAEGDILCVNGN